MLGRGAGILQGLTAQITRLFLEIGLHEFNVFLPESIVSTRGQLIEGVVRVTASISHAPNLYVYCLNYQIVNFFSF